MKPETEFEYEVGDLEGDTPTRQLEDELNLTLDPEES